MSKVDFPYAFDDLRFARGTLAVIRVKTRRDTVQPGVRAIHAFKVDLFGSSVSTPCWPFSGDCSRHDRVHRTKAAPLGEVASGVTDFSFVGKFAGRVVDVSNRRVAVEGRRLEVTSHTHLTQVLSSSRFR